jgi:hypothetical protein
MSRELVEIDSFSRTEHGRQPVLYQFCQGFSVVFRRLRIRLIPITPVRLLATERHAIFVYHCFINTDVLRSCPRHCIFSRKSAFLLLKSLISIARCLIRHTIFSCPHLIMDCSERKSDVSHSYLRHKLVSLHYS